MLACLGEFTTGGLLPLATADYIYSDENNFLPLALSTSSTSAPLPPQPAVLPRAIKSQKRRWGGRGRGRGSMIIELSAQPWVSWIWGVSQPTRPSLQLIGKGLFGFLITLKDDLLRTCGMGPRQKRLLTGLFLGRPSSGSLLELP